MPPHNLKPVCVRRYDVNPATTKSKDTFVARQYDFAIESSSSIDDQIATLIVIRILRTSTQESSVARR
jgi:hypothetical protein